MKPCISCIHIEVLDNGGKTFFKCLRPSVVTGEPSQSSWSKCGDERTNLALCGPDGRFWEGKPKELAAVAGKTLAVKV